MHFCSQSPELLICFYLRYNPLIVCRIDKDVDVRILFLIGITVGIVLSSGTGVMAASNTTGNKTKSEVGSAKELEKLTSNNSLGNLSSLTTFNNTGSNQSSNQISNQTGNKSG